MAFSLCIICTIRNESRATLLFQRFKVSPGVYPEWMRRNLNNKSVRSSLFIYPSQGQLLNHNLAIIRS